MDQKLVAMLKEQIAVSPTVENTSFGTMVNSVNYRTTRRNEPMDRSSENRAVNKKLSKIPSDNNATIAIKILYDSCMKEGKISKTQDSSIKILIVK